MSKQIAVVFCSFRLASEHWQPPVLAEDPAVFIARIAVEYAKYGVSVCYQEAPDIVLEVRGYADLLNTVRLRTNDSMLGNPCLGHVIGESKACNLLEDLERGLSRLAFAPETIEPDGASKRVCHNCGCGC